MKVIEHYDRASDALISFESIPRKRGGSGRSIVESLDKVVEKVRPPFIDVTYHAAEAHIEERADGTLKRVVRRKRPGTVGLCAAILHRYGIDPVPHLICEDRKSTRLNSSHVAISSAVFCVVKERNSV